MSPRRKVPPTGYQGSEFSPEDNARLAESAQVALTEGTHVIDVRVTPAVILVPDVIVAEGYANGTEMGSAPRFTRADGRWVQVFLLPVELGGTA